MGKNKNRGRSFNTAGKFERIKCDLCNHSILVWDERDKPYICWRH